MNCEQQQQRHYELNHGHTWLHEEVLCPLNQVIIELLPPDVIAKYGCAQQSIESNEVLVKEENTEDEDEVFIKEEDKVDDQNPKLAVKVEKFCQTLSDIFKNSS